MQIYYTYSGLKITLENKRIYVGRYIASIWETKNTVIKNADFEDKIP